MARGHTIDLRKIEDFTHLEATLNGLSALQKVWCEECACQVIGGSQANATEWMILSFRQNFFQNISVSGDGATLTRLPPLWEILYPPLQVDRKIL